MTIEECKYYKSHIKSDAFLRDHSASEMISVNEKIIDTAKNRSEIDYVDKAQQIRKLVPVPQDSEDDYIKASPENECEDCHVKGTDLLICCQCRKKICPNCVIETMNGEQYCQECDDNRPPDRLIIEQESY